MNAIKSTRQWTPLMSRLAAGCVLVAGLALASVSPALANGNNNSNNWNNNNNGHHDDHNNNNNNGHHDDHNNYHSEYSNRNNPYYNNRAPYAVRHDDHYDHYDHHDNYYHGSVIYARPAPVYVAPSPGLNIIVPLHIN